MIVGFDSQCLVQMMLPNVCSAVCKHKFKLAGTLPPFRYFQCNAIIPQSGIQDVRKYSSYRWREPEEARGEFPPFFRV